MANVIKLKTGTSTPTTSDITNLEVAIDKSAAKLYLNDNGTIKEIGGGGGNSISDGDKGDITVASSGASWTIDSGVIDNANIASNAAISGSKITPTFISNISIIKDQPTITFYDSSDNPDYYIGNIDGVLKIRDITNSTDRFVINSDGHVDVLGNLDVGSGLDVTGAITATGNLTITNSFPKIDLVKDSTSYQINNENGVFNIKQNYSINKIQINTDGHVDITAHLDAEGGIDVTGHATVSQSLTVTGTTSLGETLNITGNDPNITFVDSNNNPDFKIFGNGGTLNFVDSTNSANRLVINSDGHVDIPGNLDCGAGLDVTGNITVSGTVDGVDIASLNSTVSGKLSNIVEDTSPQLGGDLDMNSKFISSGILGIKNTGSQSEVRLYCEASNAHYAAVQAPAHSVFSGNVTLTLPAAAGNQSIVGTTETQTLTNKTIDVDNNTISNIEVDNFKSGVLDTDLSSVSSNDDTLASAKAIKAYVDSNSGGGGGGGISNVVEDTTPQLGGNLDMQSNNITGTGTITANSVASSANGMRKITASTSAPTNSDGADGDVWIKYTA